MTTLQLHRADIMDWDSIDRTVATVIGSAAAVLAVVFKFRRTVASDNKAVEADNATTEVVTLLRAEVKRLAEQNTKLAEAVNALQLQVVKLRQENAYLRRGGT